MESKHIACNLSGEDLEHFEKIRAFLSFGGALNMSDGNVIKYLMKSLKEFDEIRNSKAIPNES